MAKILSLILMVLGLLAANMQGMNIFRRWSTPVNAQAVRIERERLAQEQRIKEEVTILYNSYLGCVQCQSLYRDMMQYPEKYTEKAYQDNVGGRSWTDQETLRRKNRLIKFMQEHNINDPEIDLDKVMDIAEYPPEDELLRKPVNPFNPSTQMPANLQIPVVSPAQPIPSPSRFHWLSSSLSLLKTALWNNVIPIAGITGAVAYLALLYKFFSASEYLRDDSTWHFFKDFLTEKEFMSFNMTFEILDEITQRYTVNTEEEKVPALLRFLKDTQDERRRLRSFINWHERIKFFMLDLVVPSQLEELATAEARITKLDYMQMLIKNYLQGMTAHT